MNLLESNGLLSLTYQIMNGITCSILTFDSIQKAQMFIVFVLRILKNAGPIHNFKHRNIISDVINDSYCFYLLFE